MLKLLKYFKPFAASAIFVVILTFIQSLTDLFLPTLMADIVNNGMLKGNIGYIWKYGSLMLLIAAAGGTSAIIGSFIASKISMGFGKNLRSIIFARIESFSLNEFDKISASSLITRTTNDVTQVQNVTFMIMRMMLMAPIMCIGGLVMAFYMDPKLTVVIVVALLILLGLVIETSKSIIPLYGKMQNKLDNLNLVTREGLSGIRVIRAFNKIAKEKERFEKSNYDLTEIAIKVNKIMAAMMPLMMFTMNVTSIAVIWFGSYYVNKNELQIGGMMAFLQYAMLIMFSLLMFSMMFVMIPRAQASAVRINEVLSILPEINDVLNPQKIEDGISSIEFKDVAFNYHGAEQAAISGINFKATKGEIIAIIGGTGAGKSTLINLIPRFYDVTNGSVLINGIDVRNICQKELRDKIGLVPQKTMLFTGSISDNIRFGKENADDSEITAAAETSQSMEFINERQESFDAEISQGGKNISGGQKQRLAIARALVRKPDVYIFDDSFSALDFKTDANLRSALKKETENSIMFFVSQRVSTIMSADRIIVLDDGNIAGIGKHKELMQTCEVYKEIVASQLSEEELQ